MVVISRRVSTGFMAVYWVALPFVALLMLGLGWALLAPGVKQTKTMVLPLWLSFTVSVLLTLTIIWRLWAHERARRLANENADLLEGIESQQ